MAADVQYGNEPSMTGLVKGIVDDVQTLTKQQFQLLKAEVKEDVGKTVQAGTLLGAGLVILLLGALLLFMTLGFLLHDWFPQHLSLGGAFAIVTAVVLVAGVGLFFVGLQKFRSFNPLPDRSAEALKENVQCLTNPK